MTGKKTNKKKTKKKTEHPSKPAMNGWIVGIYRLGTTNVKTINRNYHVPARLNEGTQI